MGKLANRLYYDFKLEECGYDFMGYTFDEKRELSYHHIQPRQYGGKTTYILCPLFCAKSAIFCK